MHDRNGTPLLVGDLVLVEAVVGSVFAAEEYCNVTLVIGHEAPHGPANVHSTVTLNARQTLLLERVGVPASEPVTETVPTDAEGAE